MLLIVLISVSICCILTYIWATWDFDYWKKYGVPYIKPTFFFGNVKDLILFKKNIGDIYYDFYWKYPSEPAVGTFKLGTPQLMLRDMNLIKTVCNKEFNSFHDNEMYVDSKVDPVGMNPFLSIGDEWKALRNMHTQTISKLKNLFPSIVNIYKNLEDFIRENENKPLEAKPLAVKYITDIIAYCVYGIKLNSFNNFKEPFHLKVISFYSRTKFLNASMMLISFVPWFVKALRIRFTSKQITEYLTEIIKDLFENSSRKHSEEMNNILHILVNEHFKNDKSKFTYEELASHSLTYFSGFDSTSTQLTFLLYMLALHPQIQDKVREEIKENENLVYEELYKMKYLDAVINESMRMYPSCLVIKRTCTKDIVLTSGERKYPIRKGMTVILPVYALHKDPTYFPGPTEFNPDRFYSKDLPPQFLPFGTGPRMCFGAKFALMITKIALIHILKSYRIQLPDGDDGKMPTLSINSIIVLPNEELWLKFQKIK